MNFRRIKLSLALTLFIIPFVGCRQETKTHNAFLIRNNKVHFDDYQRGLLKETNTNRIYIKIFDVVFNEWQQRPLPLAQVEFDPASLKWLKSSGIEIVPAVYVNNDLLEKVNSERINALADRVMMLLKTRLDQFDIMNWKTIHIDCDWSASSRDKYFSLLNYFATLPLFSGKEISVAVRPKQVERSGEFGLPPVTRVVYILDMQREKFDPASIGAYPLALDLSLPLFNDPIVFRNNSAMGAISGLPDSVWMNERVCRIVGEHSDLTKNPEHFEVTKDTVISQHYLKAGDQIEYVGWDTSIVSRLVGLIQSNLKSPERTVILNQLDSIKIRQYNASQLKAAFSSFNKN